MRRPDPVRETSALLQVLGGDLLDALGAQIAVLDAKGRVVAVNERWKRFARENGGDGSGCYVGADYLAACESASQRGDEAAGRVLSALRELLGGARGFFEVEYPCHSPTEQRWFVAHLSSFTHDGDVFVVTAHEEITARMAVEQRLESANAELDAINHELQQALGRERQMARTDDLTGIGNRRRFFEVAETLFAVARRYRTPFSLCIFDIDSFKQINDRLGHLGGDEILRQVARVTASQTRDADLVARYGGEEFILAMPNTEAGGAFAAAENIREAIAARRQCWQGVEIRVTVSAGVAQMLPDEGSLDILIGRADAALYEAKAAGRNCTRVAAQKAAP
jgi:diguanylate cyclase (GGDEF)-like protein